MGSWPGQELRGIQGLYGKPDLDRMEADTQGIERAAVVGGGLIGIELCEMMHSRGIHVSFLVREETFWSSVLPAEESALVTQHIRDHHIDLRTGTELAEFQDDGSGRVESLLTKAGETIPAQFVGISIGVRPNIDLLKNTALETDKGILVNPLPANQPLRRLRHWRLCSTPHAPGRAQSARTDLVHGTYHGRDRGADHYWYATLYKPGVFFQFCQVLRH